MSEMDRMIKALPKTAHEAAPLSRDYNYVSVKAALGKPR
jgi:hypothetical protein